MGLSDPPGPARGRFRGLLQPFRPAKFFKKGYTGEEEQQQPPKLFEIGSIQPGHRLKKTKGLEPPPNPNWHPSGLDKSSLQTQIQLFEIGSIQSPSEENLEPPPNPNWHPSGLDKSSLQANPIVQDWKHPVRAPSEKNYRPRATPKPKLAPLLLTSPASSKRDRCKEQVRGQERDQSSREP